MSVFDEDLKSMLGGMYQDDTEPAPQAMPALEVNAKPVEPPKAVEKPAAPAPEFVPVNGPAVPLIKAKRGLMDRLFDCFVWLGITGGIAMLLWWFWMDGLMAMEAAYPCILACGIIGAFGAGMNIRK